MSSFYKKSQRILRKLARAYSRWRIQPTEMESRAYNTTDRILLTFDDYGDRASVHALLDILEAKNVRAAFFIVGQWAEKDPSIFDAITSRGHWLGNHTYSHQMLTKLDAAEAEQEILRGPKSTLLRPPYGAYNRRIREIAARLGYKIAFWTIDTNDWRNLSTEQIQERVWEELHPGACILMHLGQTHTLETLPALIDGIRARGFELCSEGTEIAL